MSDKELLIECIKNGNLDTGMLLKQIESMRNNEYLQMHKLKIWRDKNGNYLTNLPVKEGRKQVSSKTKEGLEKKIIEHYKVLEYSPTIEDVFNKWLNEKLNTDISKGTYDRYKTDFYRFFNEDIRNKHIKDVSSNEIIIFIKTAIKQQGLTYKAYSGMRIILKGILKYAKVNNLSDISVTDLFDSLEINKRNFKYAYKPDDSQIYPDNDIGKLIEYVEQDNINRDYALAVLFLLRTGVRIGELGAIRKDDVVNGILSIKRQYISYKGKKRERIYKTVDYAKSQAGMREIILTDKAKEIVLLAESRNPCSPYLFTCKGRQLTSSVLNNYLRNVCKKIAIQYRSVHKIRKTFATMLINNGVDEIYIKTIMGHEDINTTRSHYYYCNKRKKDYEEQIKSAITI